MVQADELDALDLLIWLGTGTEAARHCNQSTISRRVHQLHRFLKGRPWRVDAST